jgi:hypothetical protein
MLICGVYKTDGHCEFVRMFELEFTTTEYEESTVMFQVFIDAKLFGLIFSSILLFVQLFCMACRKLESLFPESDKPPRRSEPCFQQDMQEGNAETRASRQPTRPR